MRKGKTFVRIAATLVATALLLSSCVIILSWLEGNAELTLELSWDGDEDLDLYLTYPDVNTTADPDDPPTYSSVSDAYEPDPLSPANAGFYPEDVASISSSLRNHVYEDRTESADGDVVWRDYGENDNREVIKIKQLPFNYTLAGDDYNTSRTAENGLPAGYDFAWVGVLEAYVYGHNANVSDARDVTLTIYDSNDRSLGTYKIPEEITVKGASLVRIPVFQVQGEDLVYYQVLAHTQLLTSSAQIRSVGDVQTIGDYHVIGTFSAEGDE